MIEVSQLELPDIQDVPPSQDILPSFWQRQ
jgi:hypothetical protein